MKTWLTQTVPAWLGQNGIPPETPITFAEYGRSSDESNPNNEQGQAAWIDGQFAAVWPKPIEQFLGACLFVYDTQFWKDPPEPNYAATDFVITTAETASGRCLPRTSRSTRLTGTPTAITAPALSGIGTTTSGG
jgi:hypothetical protein